MALCEAAAYYKEKGLTLWDQMLKIYEKYGYYKETLVSITMKGVDGAEKIQKILSDMRANPPKELEPTKFWLSVTMTLTPDLIWRPAR